MRQSVAVADQSFQESLIRVMEDGTPSKGDDLLGMEIDFTAYLSQLAEVEMDSVNVKRTGEAKQLIGVSCRAAPGVPLESALRAVEAAWEADLRYPYFEAHKTTITDDGAYLDFVTQMGPGRLYVTGRAQIVRNQ